jgi:predicted AAA+ superfamily ATPase
VNFSRYAQDIFLIFEVKRFSYKVKEQLRFPKKVYVIDHALIKAIRFFTTDNYGRILENIVFLELKRRKREIYYCSENRECDFIVGEKNRITQAIQVTRSISSEKTKEREIKGLLNAMKEYSLEKGYIFTEDETDTVTVDNKTIKVIPVWYWLLFEKTE